MQDGVTGELLRWERAGVVSLLVAAVIAFARGIIIPAAWHRQRVAELVQLIEKQDVELATYRDMLRKSHEALVASAQSAQVATQVTSELSRRKS